MDRRVALILIWACRVVGRRAGVLMLAAARLRAVAERGRCAEGGRDVCQRPVGAAAVRRRAICLRMIRGPSSARRVVLASFRESAYDAPDLGGIAEHIELSLGHQAPEGKFVTAIMAEIDQDGAEIRLLNCGHPAPLLVSGGLARLAEPVEAALPLGLAGLAAGDRKECTVPFGPGDRMLFYTDGISEARDKAGAFYPLDRCGALLGGPDPDAALGRFYDDVLGHVGGRLPDDSAALFVMHALPRPRRGNPSISASHRSPCPPASWPSLPIPLGGPGMALGILAVVTGRQPAVPSDLAASTRRSTFRARPSSRWACNAPARCSDSAGARPGQSAGAWSRGIAIDGAAHARDRSDASDGPARRLPAPGSRAAARPDGRPRHGAASGGSCAPAPRSWPHGRWRCPCRIFNFRICLFKLTEAEQRCSMQVANSAGRPAVTRYSLDGDPWLAGESADTVLLGPVGADLAAGRVKDIIALTPAATQPRIEMNIPIWGEKLT